MVEASEWRGRGVLGSKAVWLNAAVCITLCLSLVNLFTHARDTTLTHEFVPHPHSNTGAPLFIPHPALHPLHQASRTLYLLPANGEDRPHDKFNYAYKFLFYIRCFVLAAVAEVRVLDSVQQVVDLARTGDVVLVIARGAHATLELRQLISHRDAGEVHPTVCIGAFHTADEQSTDRIDWYKDVDLVLRNYFRPDAHQSLFVPIGPKIPDQCHLSSCTCPAVMLPTAADRTHLFHLSISMRSQRKDLIDAVKANASFAQQGYIHVAKQFGGDGPDAKEMYLRQMIDSKFVFAPCGNVLETHRMWEALAMGAIPLIQNCSHSASWWPLQNLVFNSFDDAIRFVQTFDARPNDLNALQAQTQDSWQKYTHSIANQVGKLLVQCRHDND